MIGFITLGTNDLPRAAAFYDALLPLLGARRSSESARYVGWSSAQGAPMLLAIVPHDGQRATPGNGTMVALQAQDRGFVDQVHRKALELGATDEGAAGPRNGSFYGGYFRDPDGIKLVVYCMQA